MGQASSWSEPWSERLTTLKHALNQLASIVGDELNKAGCGVEGGFAPSGGVQLTPIPDEKASERADTLADDDGRVKAHTDFKEQVGLRIDSKQREVAPELREALAALSVLACQLDWRGGDDAEIMHARLAMRSGREGCCRPDITLVWRRWELTANDMRLREVCIGAEAFGSMDRPLELSGVPEGGKAANEVFDPRLAQAVEHLRGYLASLKKSLSCFQTPGLLEPFRKIGTGFLDSPTHEGFHTS